MKIIANAALLFQPDRRRVRTRLGLTNPAWWEYAIGAGAMASVLRLALEVL